jgi:hypothetical protein
MAEISYWAGNGKHQQYVDSLQLLVPTEGSVLQPYRNKALEKFRKASNCYYDLYNNGLGNRAKSFAKVFGINTSYHRMGQYRFDQQLYVRTEAVMDEIILAAAKEQGLVAEGS